MIKQLTFFFLIVLINLSAISQTVGKFSYKNKIYNVYPFRIDDSEDIILVGYKIPDGEYIAFANYNFKVKRSLKSTKKHVLTDTTIVKGIFTIKNNTAEGPAVFYNYIIGNHGKQNKAPYEEIRGAFVNGLKSGLWSEATIGKEPTEFTSYQNGIKHGYHWRSGYLGNLYFKEKYCDGDKCDTVFYYRNGKIYKEYDVTTEYYSNSKTSCYDKGIDLLGIGDNKINTYYKSYENGKLELDLKYKNGKVLPYDSIGMLFNKKGLNYYKYVTIKSIDDNKKYLTYKNTSSINKQIDEFLYEDEFLYKSKATNYRKVYGKKSLFGKRKLKTIDTIVHQNYYLNPNKIIDSSVVPLMVVQLYRSNYNTEMYYIPKYKFIFEKDQNIKSYRRYNDINVTFNRLDTITKRIYMNGKNYGVANRYQIKKELVFIHEDIENLNRLKLRAFTKKAYIVTNEIPAYYEKHESHNRKLHDFDADVYQYFPTKETYYKHDTALNGIYCFSDNRKSKNWPKIIIHTGRTGLEDDICLGQFVNGRKEGFWTELDCNDSPTRTPLELKSYFFSNPKRVESYSEKNFKNGVLNGSYVHYDKYDPKDDDSRSKEPIVLFKEIESNYVNDTLDGNYKKYYRNGKLMQELNLVMGSPDGACREYNMDGELESSIQFTKGYLNGKYMKYENNSPTCIATFKDNLLCDSLVYFYPNHTVSEKVLAKNDTVIKKVKYYENGKVKEEMIFNNQSAYTIGEELMVSQSFIETIIASEFNSLRNVNGDFKNYYESGQILSEGYIKGGDLKGIWKFYSINGVMIHEVDFQDTIIQLPLQGDTTDISGFYTGYYSNGKKRCDGYIKDLEVSYDCFTKQDKADLDFYALNFFDINGKQTLKDGNGYFIKYEANGLRMAAGKLINCKEDSLWRYYTPEQKLDQIGNYVNHNKDGVWYEGDLEGINFEDGACFDMNNKEEAKEFNQKRKELMIKTTTYRNGNVIDAKRFESNLNKTYKPKRRKGHNYSATF